MSFERDSDAYTRGVGAIASADRMPRRIAARARRAARLRARDKQIAMLGSLGQMTLDNQAPGGKLPGGGSGGGRGTVIVPPPPNPKYLPPWARVNTGVSKGSNGGAAPLPGIINDPGPVTRAISDGGSTSVSVSAPPPGVVIAPPGPSPSDNTNVYLALGAAAAVYFLFFRKGG